MIDLVQYQYFFPASRFGVGLCPVGCGHALPTERCIAGRVARALEYGVNELDMWALMDSTVHNVSETLKMWRPFIGPQRAFLAGDDDAIVRSGAGSLCWNETV